MASNREQIAIIKQRYFIGLIDYEQAKSEMQPILDEMNARGKEIAKKFKQRFKPFTFSSIMR